MADELEQDEEARQADVDTAWSIVRASLRTAARTGLPRPEIRAEIARELESMAQWLRIAGRPQAPATQPRQSRSRAHRVRVRHDRRRRDCQMQLQIDWPLWNELLRPDFVYLEVSGGQLHLHRDARPGAVERYVWRKDRRVLVYCQEEDLGGLAEGSYAAEIVEGAIVIGEVLGGGEQTA